MRKFICPAKLSNESPAELLKEVCIREWSEFNKETNTYDCKYCGKKYKTSAGKSYHNKRCTKKNKPVETVATTEKERVDVLEQKNKELEEQIQELRRLVIAAPHILNNNNNTNSHNTQNNNITNNINILDFGSENTSTLTHEFLKDCLYRCQPIETLPEDGENGLTKLIKHIHSLPENKNVRVRNLNQCLMEKRQDNRWIAADKSAVLDEMVSKGYQIIDKFKDRNRDDLEDDVQFQGVIEDIDEYLDEVSTKNKHVVGPIKRDVYIMLINDKSHEIVLLERRPTTLVEVCANKNI